MNTPLRVLAVGVACVALSGCSGASKRSFSSVHSDDVARVDPAAAVPASRTEQWWIDRHQSILDTVRAGGHTIAFIGDSITQQWESAGKDVWAADWAPRGAINCGIGGDRTQHVIGRLDDGLMQALAAPNNAISTVVIHIGTNNTAEPADSAADIAAGITSIVDRVQTGLPSARIVLMSIFPRGARPNAQRYMIDDINARIAPLAKGPNVTILDIGPRLLTADRAIPKELMPDFLHLSPEAYRIWSDALKAELDRK